MARTRAPDLALLGIATTIVALSSPAATHEPKTLPAAASRLAVTLPAEIDKTLRDYRTAMEARSLERLASTMDADLVVLEGTHTNVGWVDYRDNHIGPEMKEWQDFVTQTATVVDAIVAGDVAYAATESTYRIVTAGKPIVLDATETFVLRKGRSGWRIRHIHISGRPRRQNAPAEKR